MSSIRPVFRPSYILAAYGTTRKESVSSDTGHPPPAKDRVTLSQDARELSQKEKRAFGELSSEEKKLVQELKKRDAEVRAHEQAHQSVAGKLAMGGATFTYQKGPNGKNYAVEGEVKIDTSAVAGDPEATQRKARAIRAAALAPVDPSPQDRAVAAAASQMEAEAKMEKRETDSPLEKEELESDRHRVK